MKNLNSTADRLNKLFREMSPDPLAKIIKDLLNLLNQYTRVNPVSKIKDKIEHKNEGLTDSEQKEIKETDYSAYTMALEERFPTFIERRFNFVPAEEYKKINIPERDKRKVSGYLLLRFHLENIKDFIDLLCFRNVLIGIAPELSKRGFHLSNNFGETINCMLVYLDSHSFKEMHTVKQLCEQHFPQFVKKFIDNILKSEEPYVEKEQKIDKDSIREFLTLIEQTPRIEHAARIERRWYHEFTSSISTRPALLDNVLHKMHLQDACTASPSAILKFYFNCNKTWYDVLLGRDDSPVRRIRNLFTEFDHLFFDKTHIIRLYLTEVIPIFCSKLPHLDRKLEIEICSLNKEQKEKFLIGSGLGFFKPLAGIVLDYLDTSSDLMADQKRENAY